MANNKIGEAYVEVTANTGKLEAGMKSAEKTTERAGRKMGGAFEQVGTKIDGATAGVRKFSGAITGSIGAVTGIIGVIVTLAGVLATLAARFAKADEEATKMQRNFRSFKDQLRDFRQSVTDSGLDPLAVQLREAKEASDEMRLSFMRARLENEITSKDLSRLLIEENEAYTEQVRLIIRLDEAKRREEISTAAVNAEKKRGLELDAEIAEMRGKYAEAEEAIIEQRRKAEEQQRRDAEAARRRMEERIHMIERERQELERIVALQREINSLGLGGTGANVGAAVGALGASRVRKGP